MKPSVAIVGAGFAGISAAAHLARAGYPVILIENLPKLGGRCLSFEDPSTGDLLDAGQHLLMGCYRETLSLLEKLGTLDRLRELPRRLVYLEPGGRKSVLKTQNSVSLLWGLLRLGTLEWKDRWAILQGLYRMRKLNEADLKSLNEMNCTQWLLSLKQTRRVIKRFWEPIIISALNETPDQAAADGLYAVVRESLLAGPEASRFLLPHTSLESLFYPEIGTVIREAGGEIRIQKKVEKLILNEDRISALQINKNESLKADYFILALPPWSLAEILKNSFLSHLSVLLETTQKHSYSSIITVYLWLKNRVWDESMTALLDSPLHWVFDLPVQKEKTAASQRLSIVQSAADRWIDLSSEEILDKTLKELFRFLPGVTPENVIHSRVFKDRRATVSLKEGSRAIRPDSTTGIQNLLLAGDWTATGIPATIESAVRSGLECARLIQEK